MATTTAPATGGTLFSPRSAVYSNFESTTPREQSRTVVSSNIVSETSMGPAPQQDLVKYVEVPVIEERIRTVPIYKTVEIEKRVPKYEIEWVEQIKEVPVYQTVDKEVVINKVEEIIKRVPRREVVEVQKEVIKTVPKVEIVDVEKIIEVPGETIERAQKYIVENKISVPRFVDKPVPMLVAQTVCPVISDTQETVDVDVAEYEPFIQIVDVHVPKVVPSHFTAVGVVEELHRVVEVPPAQFNTMLRSLNAHISDSSRIPYISTNGMTPFLSATEEIPIVSPNTLEVQGFNAAHHEVVYQGVYQSGGHQMSTSNAMGGVMIPPLGDGILERGSVAGRSHRSKLVEGTLLPKPKKNACGC